MQDSSSKARRRRGQASGLLLEDEEDEESKNNDRIATTQKPDSPRSNQGIGEENHSEKNIIKFVDLKS